jgi:hypothetical protein
MLTSFPFDMPIRDDVVCLLYGRDTGEIVFAHRVTTLGQAEPPEAKAIEREAREVLEDDSVQGIRGDLPEDIAAIIVPAENVAQGRMYRVDIGGGEPVLVEQGSRAAGR